MLADGGGRDLVEMLEIPRFTWVRYSGDRLYKAGGGRWVSPGVHELLAQTRERRRRQRERVGRFAAILRGD